MSKAHQNFKFILAIFSGILLFLCFPKPDMGLLAWIALVPMLIALEDVASRKEAFSLGLLTGLFFYTATLYWVIIAMHNYGGINYLLSLALLVLLVVYMSLYIGIFTIVIYDLKKRCPILYILAIPIGWTGLEYMRSWFFTGFPWVSLGYSQYKFLKIIQLADTIGVYGISFMIVLVNAILAYLIRTFLLGTHFNISKKERNSIIKGLISIIAIIGICYIYGYLRIKEYNMREVKEQLKVSVIQGNITQSLKWDSVFKSETVGIYEDLTKKSLQDDPEIIVWPETAVPFFFQEGGEYKDRIINLIKEANRPILFGTPRYDLNGKDYLPYNSALFLSPQGELINKYDKIHLVPFGEYIPFSNILTFLDSLVVQVGNFCSGKEYVLMNIKNSKLGAVICFEIIFPDLVRKFVKKGANLIVNLTNDAWYDRSSAPYQHFSMVVFRAVENKCSVVRCANTGISGFIDGVGNIVNSTPIFKMLYLTERLDIKKGKKTFYTMYGDIFGMLCFGLLVGYPLLRLSGFRKFLIEGR
ncbi:MAG: apolipoprotein N-acyltransferase [bacterium]